MSTTVPALKRLFRFIHHYSHALEIRSMLSSDYLRQRAHHEAYPKGLLRKIWTEPGSMEDLIQLSRFLRVDGKNLLIDIGGNTGYWAAAFLEVFPQTDIVSFEPDKRAAVKYCERFRGNQNVVLHTVALSDQSGKARLMLGKQSTFSSLEQYAETQEDRKIEIVGYTEVDKERLDDVPIATNGFDKVFLKLDVQGHEFEVLSGGVRFLKNVDVILAELSFATEYKGKEPSFSAVTNLLQSTGHYPIIFQDYGRSLSPYAWERDVIFVRKHLLGQIWGW